MRVRMPYGETIWPCLGPEIFKAGRTLKETNIKTPMRNARLLSLQWLDLALLALFAACQSLAADDDNEASSRTETAQSSPATASGKPSRPAATGFPLSLGPQRQQQSGLKTQALATFSLGLETPAYGRVLDISPLLDLRARYRSAQSDLTIAEAALRVARKSHDRLAKLHSESIIPARELIQAESQLAADQARHDAAARHVREVREEALQSFGEELFKQAAEAESSLFEGLLKHALVLALVALPTNQSLPKTARTVSIAPSGDRDQARQARLVSAAPRTEESTQGETWYFVAESLGLRTGMRLDAWIPRSGEASAGVLIPLSAVVWRDGQPWVFVKTGDDTFVRRPIGAHSVRGGDWFVAQGFAPGEEAVIVGGQMLLSEEQRRNAPKDGDDD